MLADIIFVLVILLNAIVGYRRGFFNMIGRIAVTLVSIVLAFLIISPVAGWLVQLPLFDPLEERIGTSVSESIQITEENVGSVVERMNLPEVVEILMLENLPEPDTDFTQAYPAFSAALFRLALMAFLFVMVFAVLIIAIHLMTRSLTAVSDKVPLLGLTNRLIGMTAGLVFASLQLFIAIFLLALLSPHISMLNQAIQSSRILTYLYQLPWLAAIMF